MSHTFRHDERMTHRLNLRLPPSVADALLDLAQSLDVPAAQLLRILLARGIAAEANRLALTSPLHVRHHLLLKRRRR